MHLEKFMKEFVETTQIRGHWSSELGISGQQCKKMHTPWSRNVTNANTLEIFSEYLLRI